ncbi:MAG: GlxA family transcriptional regulator [Pigmentiphaga sp.]
MLSIAILVPHGTSLSGLEQARQGLLAANARRRELRLPAAFDVACLAATPTVSLDGGRLQIRADRTLDAPGSIQLALVPPLQGPLAELLPANSALVDWLRGHYGAGGAVGSLCMGAALVAAAGLLDGRQAAVHWGACGAYARQFPRVHWLAEQVVHQEGRLYTSGGASSSAQLILHLIERHAGRDVAIWCAKWFQLDWQRTSQLPYTIFSGPRHHADELVAAVQDYLELHYSHRVGIEQLACRFTVTRRTLERRFRQATGHTLGEYLQRIRIEAAKQRLETTRRSVSEVMGEVGYLDDKSFREVFRKHCGMSPMAYRARYAGA